MDKNKNMDININQSGEYTKHYYADALRIASKLGTGFSGNLCDSTTVIENTYPGYLSNRMTIQYDEIREEINETSEIGDDLNDIYGIPYPNFCNLIGNQAQETDIFYYHPDHLGSTGMVTDNNANILQDFLYAPFGEIVNEYSGLNYNVIPKFAFNVKPFDEENNMYYYSARYYAPPTFISRDPKFEDYPSISPYTYCANNPVNAIDPTGETLWILGETGAIEYKPGMKYEGDNKFTGLVVNTLNNVISKSNFANRMVNELSKSEFNFRIVESENDRSFYDPDAFHDGSSVIQGTNGEQFYEKSGGEIRWNTKGNATYEASTPKCLSAIKVVRANINLFHELAHGWDNMAGLLSPNNNNMKYMNLPMREWMDTRTENIIRQEMGIPLRTHYGEIDNGDGTTSPSQPWLLNNQNKHIFTKYQH